MRAQYLQKHIGIEIARKPLHIVEAPGYSLIVYSFISSDFSILKGLSGDTDHVADADFLEQSKVGEFIGRSATDTENGCDVIHGVCSAWWAS